MPFAVMALKESEREELEEGDVAPGFELRGTDGATYSLNDFDGYTALLLVFTCNHCPYAQAKFGVLNGIAEDYDEVAVVGVNPNDADEYPDDSFEKMEEFVNDGTVRYDAYLRDETQEVALDYGATCTPDPFLFENRDGRFVLVYHGRLDDALNPDDEPTKHHMREAIGAVLAGEEVDKGFLPSQGCSIKWE
jgi:peroxiredoxin